MLNVPGEELDKVIHYYKEPHPYYNHDVLVVGAKNSAAIAALELFWTGARVTLIHRGAGISDRVKYWIKPNIENRIKSGEVPAYFNFAADRDSSQIGVDLEHPKATQDAQERFCFRHDRLPSGSRFPGFARHPLEPESQKPRINPETLESDRPGIYLAGVIVAGCTPTKFSSRMAASTASRSLTPSPECSG